MMMAAPAPAPNTGAQQGGRGAQSGNRHRCFDWQTDAHHTRNKVAVLIE
jgi:hypothetical protein